MRTTLLRVSDAPPLRLPSALDAASDRWVGLPPRVRFVAIAVVAVTLALVVGRRAATSPWGPVVDALVLTETVAAGSPVRAGQVELVAWPIPLLPSDALHELPEGRAITMLLAGTVLSARHIGERGIADTVAAGHVAVPVRRDQLPDLGVGVPVDLFAASLGGSPQTVAADAIVLGTDELFTWLQVRREQASAVANAAASNALSVAVLGG